MNNLFNGSDFEALLTKDDIYVSSKINKADASIAVYFREFQKDWLSFIVHILSLPDVSLEIILVNDGGKVKVNPPNDDRIALISNSETKGEMFCLKQALLQSKGKNFKFIAFPDMISPASLIHQIRSLKSYKKDISLGQVIFTKGEETTAIKCSSYEDLQKMIDEDIKNVLIYKSAMFSRQLLLTFIDSGYMSDDMYDDCLISLAGANVFDGLWSKSNVAFVEEATSLLNESPSIHDFLNMKRASIYSKGITIANYLQRIAELKKSNKKIKLAILDNNLNTGGAQWSAIQWASILPETFEVKFFLYTDGTLVDQAHKYGLNIAIWDRKLPFENWLQNEIKEWKADIVDVVWNGDLLTESVASSAPVVVAHIQSQEIPWLDNLIAKKQTSRIDHFIAVSDSIQQKYSKISDRTIIINAPVKSAKYLSLNSKRTTMRRMIGCGPEEMIVGWCGRMLSPEKRIDLLREVAEDIHSRNLPIRFVICGTLDGNTRDRDMYVWGWNKWCEENNASLILNLNPWEMHLFHSIPDVFLSMSDVEGLSLATVESLSAGHPVISTDVGGQAEAVIPGITGALIEKGSVQQAVKVILDFYDTFRSEENKRALNLMGYLGQTLINSECDIINVARQHAVAYMEMVRDES